MSLPSVDLNIRDNSGYTPLHTACEYGQLEVIKFLLSLPSVDVNIQSNSGYTPLHSACRYSQLDIIKFLVSLPSVDVKIQSNNGYTPLHSACRYSQLDIIKFLVSLPSVDVNIQSNSGYTPLHTACRYGQLDIITCLVSLPSVDVNIRIPSYPVLLHKACRNGTIDVVLFLISSSSVDVNAKDDNGYTPLHTTCHHGKLDIVKCLMSTEGINPISTDKNGNTPLHIACSNHEVDIVGSHADKRRAAENAKAIVDNCDFQQIFQQLEYKGFVAIDCRNQNKTGFDLFITFLLESSQAVLDGSDSISFYCHVLYAFLKTKLNQKTMTLYHLTQMMHDENEPSLPSNESVLLELLTILSDKGLILFINSTDSTSSWVIIEKQSLLKEINGTLFAPSHFKEYRSTLASNTGIVPVSVLSDVFPQYDSDMLVGFLKSLEFCHEIDENTLKIITTNLSSSSDKLLYFPALVSVEPSSEVTITDGFGWCLWCPNPYQFFSTRFLQVLLLRIAYVFSYQVNDVGIIHMSPFQTLDRFCHIWKNGICWTRDGVKTVVQVSEQNRSIVLLVQPLDESLALESLQVRSSITQKILQIKDEFCHSCDTQECLISNHHLNVALRYYLKNLSIFKIEDISRVLILKKIFVTSNMTESLNISSLLGQLEPYHNLPLSVIHRLFDDSNVSQFIPEHLLREIQERCRPIMDTYLVTRESSTYQSVRDHLNRFSIFAGRNPFVSE